MLGRDHPLAHANGKWTIYAFDARAINLMFSELNTLSLYAVASTSRTMFGAVAEFMNVRSAPYQKLDAWIAVHGTIMRSRENPYKKRYPQFDYVSMLSVECIDLVILELDFSSLIAFAATCKLYKELVQRRNQRIVNSILSRFTNKPQAFLRLMESTDSIISGSAALLAIIPNSLHPADLDIYVPTHSAKFFTRRLRISFGFKLHRQSLRFDSSDNETYNDIPNVEAISWLSRGGKIVNVISMKGDNAVKAIFTFHSTVVMNFISYYGVYCAYPNLTTTSKSVINTPNYRTKRTKQAIRKYKRRGFDMQNSLVGWKEYNNHICGRSKTCPQTLRTLYDRGGMFLGFPSRLVDAQDEGVIYNTSSTVVWMLDAGQFCAHQGPVVEGFATEIGITVFPC